MPATIVITENHGADGVTKELKALLGWELEPGVGVEIAKTLLANSEKTYAIVNSAMKRFELKIGK